MVCLLALVLAPHVQGDGPLYGYSAGEVKFTDSLSVGAPEKKTGIKGDGNTLYVVRIDGVGNTPAGRQVDGLYTYVDPYWEFGLPQKNCRVQLLENANPTYRDWEFYRPTPGEKYPAFQKNNSYSFLWKPAAGVDYAVVSPATKWTSPADDPLTGTYFITISLALPPGAKVQPKLTAVDCLDFIDNPGAVPVQPSPVEPKPYWIQKFAKEGKPLQGVAADGVAMVMLRCETETSGQATFTLGSTGANFGSLYPIGSEPNKSNGSLSLQVPLRKLEGGGYVALALYKPPVTLAATMELPLQFRVQFLNEDGSMREKSELQLKLVRPPVVLVHGTYDNPKFCYDTHDAQDDSPVTMAQMLRDSGFRVTLLDWEATNGMKDPSSFRHNQKTVLENRGGIETALLEMRRDGFAVAQADVICHSQGGVITRVFARGFPLTTEMTASHPHFRDTEECAKIGCWYHRADNYTKGDIHRLITISTTHRGSDVCSMFNAFEEYQSDVEKSSGIGDEWRSMLLGWFLTYVDKEVSGITTQGYKNQSPGSPQLMAIGPTPIPSHAIACVATDEDMKNVRVDTEVLTKGMGNYYGKLYKIWKLTPDPAKQYALEIISADKNPDEKERDYEKYRHEMSRWKNEYAQLSESGRQYQMDKCIYLIRKIVFRNDENDCTVSMTSSYGGLKSPYTSKMEHVLHGWAPRYRNVQAKVMELLTNDGSLFSKEGFPDSYAERSNPGVWVLSPADAAAESAGANAVAPDNPTTGAPGSLELGNLNPSSWTKPSVGGSAAVENDRLVISAAGEGGVRTFGTVPLKGDFDVAIDYKLVDWRPSEASAPALDIYLSSKPEIVDGTIQITRGDFEDGAAYIFVEPGEVQKEVTGNSGNLRIQRVGRTWTIFMSSGAGWQKLLEIAHGAGDVFLGFGVTPNGKDAAKASVRPSSFKG